MIGSLDDAKVAGALLGALNVDSDELAALISSPYSVVTVGHELNRANLSVMVRAVVLARGLEFSIQDLLRLVKLSGQNPFAGGPNPVPADTRRTWEFVRMVDKIASASFTIPDLDAVLAHHLDPASSDIPTDAELAKVLDDIRAGLQAVVETTSDREDPKGDITRKKLGLLQWNAGLVEASMGTLLGNTVYSADLAVLPFADFPEALKAKVGYDADTRVLRFGGPMTLAERIALNALSNDVPYQAAVTALFDAPRTFVAQRMQAFVLPTFSAALAALPGGVAFPKDLKQRAFYDSQNSLLKFVGFMTDTERATLRQLSNNANYQNAVDALFNATAAYVTPAANRFLTAADATAFFDNAATTVDDRLRRLLDKLMPYLRRTLSESLVKQKVGEAVAWTRQPPILSCRLASSRRSTARRWPLTTS